MTLHPSILRTLNLEWPNESACTAFAQSLAANPAIGQAFVTLKGSLGAGKTTLARALLRALGVQGRIKSPTYALLEPYELEGLNIAHMDLYRLLDPSEWQSAGLRDTMAASGLKLVEWPERAGALLPTPDLAVHIQSPAEDASLADEARRVTVHAYTPCGVALLQSMPTAKAAT